MSRLNADSGSDADSTEPNARRAVTTAKTARVVLTQALARSEKRFQLLVDSVQDYAIFMLDPEGRIVSWNEGARRIKGYAESEILGRHFSIFYPPDETSRGEPQRNLDQAAAHGRWETEGWRVRRDGSRFWANVVISAIFDAEGSLVGFGKVTHDLTDQKRALEERIQLIQEREARLAAEQSIRAREEFVSIAAHELKTPITSLRLQTQVQLRRIRAGQLNGEALARALDVIDDQARKLANLVNQLLDVSRVSGGRLDLERIEVDVGALVQGVAERLATLSMDRTIHVSAPTELIARVDPLRLEQVVTNLIENAIKYDPSGAIEVSVEQPDERTFQITVRDHGPGVPVDRRARLFDRFYQAEGRRHRSGLGLGLYISREIVHHHQGEIRAEFPSDGGARFVVTIPLERINQRDE